MSRNAFAECEREYNAREEAIELNRQEREQVMDIKREVTLRAENESIRFEYDVSLGYLYLWDKANDYKLMASVYLYQDELISFGKFINMAIEEMKK